ncbi:hypothetical protein [Ralstonia mannitolilytica]|uniref:ScoMcrA-like SRA domain-containing protein n=1 Tax=Ralstonia mannitolilytica TaxID=105219 RepID=A0AAJ4ZJ56_9RALS|nr:hypothetical protein [Ralstonia mannitolilytica]CAG2146923.1 hypothetical protein LMG6866_03190 [Ralstonia mannitolilytica]SUD96094.1 Uncharacterised protein [Ralstonia mannitolilytica]
MLPSNDQETVQPKAATATEIPEFVIGKAYNRKKEITGKFGGSGQSGIAPSRQSPAIFLFTGTGGQHGYTDEFDAFGYVNGALMQSVSKAQTTQKWLGAVATSLAAIWLTVTALHIRSGKAAQRIKDRVCRAPAQTP